MASACRVNVVDVEAHTRMFSHSAPQVATEAGHHTVLDLVVGTAPLVISVDVGAGADRPKAPDLAGFFGHVQLVLLGQVARLLLKELLMRQTRPRLYRSSARPSGKGCAHKQSVDLLGTRRRQSTFDSSLTVSRDKRQGQIS